MRDKVCESGAVASIALQLGKNRTKYNDLGADFFQKRSRESLIIQNIRRLEALGFTVTLEKAA